MKYNYTNDIYWVLKVMVDHKTDSLVTAVKPLNNGHFGTN